MNRFLIFIAIGDIISGLKPLHHKAMKIEMISGNIILKGESQNPVFAAMIDNILVVIKKMSADRCEILDKTLLRRLGSPCGNIAKKNARIIIAIFLFMSDLRLVFMRHIKLRNCSA